MYTMYRTTRTQHTHFCMLTRTAPMRSKTCLLVRITAVAEILGLGYGGPKGLGVFFLGYCFETYLFSFGRFKNVHTSVGVTKKLGQ